jgi:predicted nucleotidyltransferase
LLDILAAVQAVTQGLGCPYLLVDRGLQDNKDAQDLFFLLKHYHEAGNDARLWNDAFDVLEACGYDPALAGAALLAILTDPRKRDRLVVHMTRSAGTESDTADKLLRHFELGLRTKKIPAA